MWIKTTSVSEASGLLKKEYDEAVKRAGRVAPIIRSMSVNPSVLNASIRLYKTIMLGNSPLTRVQRELLATVVAVELECHF